jgi:putative ABC transport system ATP-binding protein
MAIEMRGVVKNYSTPAGAFTALRGVDLDIGSGRFAAIVGKSGSGKSTLLNLIGGIDRASAGSIRVGGENVETMTENALASWRGRSVGLVFQFFQLLPTLTAVENVMLPMDFAGLTAVADRRPRAQALLERMGIANQANKLPSSLSGGQAQRVAIARALANQPKVILADEPTGNLDSATAREVLELFRGLASGDVTVVIATHERDIGQLVDRRFEIQDGALVS